jgi:Skp family chaperone for outer membrane proteins
MTTKTAFASLFLALMAGAAAAQQAPRASVVQPQDKTQSSPRLNPVAERADRLSNHMVRDLHLNNYQATKLRAINADKVAKMAAIERKNAGNQKLIDEECNGVCKERDKELMAVLSNDQYSSYFGSRATYYKYDKDYASQSASILLTNSVQNPAPARANDASITSTPDKPANRPAGNLGRNAR